MEIKPVKNTRRPGYPSLEYFSAHPELLARHTPVTWMRNKVVAGSLAAFVLLGNPDPELPESGKPMVVMAPLCNPLQDQQQQPQDSVKIAPIFVHGDGTGATGCIVVSPPVFIAEDEALKIIFGKLKEEGLHCVTENTGAISFKSKQIAISCISETEREKYPQVEVEIKMDGFEKTTQFAIEYVSAEDYQLFADEKNLRGCSVTEYDTRGAADILRSELVKKGKSNTVVFYDPITSFEFRGEKNWEAGQKKAQKSAEELLLDQVSDFISWLKKENIIKQ